MNEQTPELKILIVYCHPGDLACEASGTVVLHTRRGDEVHCLMLSDGERHHNDLIHRELAKAPPQRDPTVVNISVDGIKTLKRQEAERMCDLLGIHRLTCFGWPDVL